MICIWIFAFLAFAFTFQIEQSKISYERITENKRNSLTFSYTKGEGYSQEWIASFKKYAVSASKFYGPSALDNVQSIANRMNDDTSLNFSVLIQMNTNYYVNYRINSPYDIAFASFGPGFNNIYPQWSYLTFANRLIIRPLVYIFTNSLGQGKGYNSSEVEKIVNAALTSEGSLACYCIESQFKYFLSQITGLYNNAICQSDNPATGYIQVLDDRWLVIKPKNCYYTIWSN